jgi:hypothetical protein
MHGDSNLLGSVDAHVQRTARTAKTPILIQTRAEKQLWLSVAFQNRRHAGERLSISMTFPVSVSKRAFMFDSRLVNLFSMVVNRLSMLLSLFSRLVKRPPIEFICSVLIIILMMIANTGTAIAKYICSLLIFLQDTGLNAR